jgi:hypothetical protein
MGLNEKQQKALDCYMSMSMRQWPEALHAWIAATSVHDPILSGDGATSPPGTHIMNADWKTLEGLLNRVKAHDFELSQELWRFFIQFDFDREQQRAKEGREADDRARKSTLEFAMMIDQWVEEYKAEIARLRAELDDLPAE